MGLNDKLSLVTIETRIKESRFSLDSLNRFLIKCIKWFLLKFQPATFLGCVRLVIPELIERETG